MHFPVSGTDHVAAVEAVAESDTAPGPTLQDEFLAMACEREDEPVVLGGTPLAHWISELNAGVRPSTDSCCEPANSSADESATMPQRGVSEQNEAEHHNNMCRQSYKSPQTRAEPLVTMEHQLLPLALPSGCCDANQVCPAPPPPSRTHTHGEHGESVPVISDDASVDLRVSTADEAAAAGGGLPTRDSASTVCGTREMEMPLWAAIHACESAFHDALTTVRRAELTTLGFRSGSVGQPPIARIELNRVLAAVSATVPASSLVHCVPLRRALSDSLRTALRAFELAEFDLAQLELDVEGTGAEDVTCVSHGTSDDRDQESPPWYVAKDAGDEGRDVPLLMQLAEDLKRFQKVRAALCICLCRPWTVTGQADGQTDDDVVGRLQARRDSTLRCFIDEATLVHETFTEHLAHRGQQDARLAAPSEPRVQPHSKGLQQALGTIRELSTLLHDSQAALKALELDLLEYHDTTGGNSELPSKILDLGVACARNWPSNAESMVQELCMLLPRVGPRSDSDSSVNADHGMNAGRGSSNCDAASAQTEAETVSDVNSRVGMDATPASGRSRPAAQQVQPSNVTDVFMAPADLVLEGDEDDDRWGSGNAAGGMGETDLVVPDDLLPELRSVLHVREGDLAPERVRVQVGSDAALGSPTTTQQLSAHDADDDESYTSKPRTSATPGRSVSACDDDESAVKWTPSNATSFQGAALFKALQGVTSARALETSKGGNSSTGHVFQCLGESESSSDSEG